MTTSVIRSPSARSRPTAPSRPRCANGGFKCFSLGAGSRRDYLSALRRLRTELSAQDASILHAHCFDPTLLAALVSRLSNVRFVFTRHHSDHHIRLGKRWHTRIDGACARRADRVIAVSEATRRILEDAEGVPAEKIVVIHNGMEPLRSPDPRAVADLRRRLGGEEKRVLLQMARLHEEKGHRVLFDALPRIVAGVGAVTLCLAGEGSGRRELEEAARERGLGSAVVFLGQRSDVPELIAASDVVVLPSLAESFGFAAVEALSVGKPVVVSDADGLREVVGDAALVVPRGDSVALADAVVRALDDPREAERLRAAGPPRAAWFSAERMIRGYEGVYDDLG